MKSKIPQLILSFSLIFWPLWLLLAVPIEQVISLGWYQFIRLVTFFLFIGGAIEVLRQKQKKLILALVGLTAGVVCVIQYSLSTRLFLGNEIGVCRYAEAPGGDNYLRVYDSGKCTITFESIFGTGARYYADYKLEQGCIWVETNQNLYEFTSFSLEIRGRAFKVRQR